MRYNKNNYRWLLAFGLIKKVILIHLFFNGTIYSQTIEYINSEIHLSKNYPFSQATQVNGILYLSGQIGTNTQGKLVSGGIEAETKQTMLNIKALLESMDLSLDNVFKCTCMLADISDWPAMSKVYKSFFPTNRLPARSAFAGSGLALGAGVEIECLATTQ